MKFKCGVLNGIIHSKYCLTYFFHGQLCKIRLDVRNDVLLPLGRVAVVLQIQDMVEFGNC